MRGDSITAQLEDAVDPFKKLLPQQVKELLQRQVFRQLGDRWGEAA